MIPKQTLVSTRICTGTFDIQPASFYNFTGETLKNVLCSLYAQCLRYCSKEKTNGFDVSEMKPFL